MGVRIGALLVVLCSAVPAHAADGDKADEKTEEPRHYGGQRSIGFGPSVGWYSGLGGMVELESGPVGLAISGAYSPLFIFGNEKNARRDVTFDYYGSGQINADVLAGPIWQTRRVDIHLLAGYRYNTVLGHGFGVGLRVAGDLSRVLRLEFHGTPAFFPSATSRLRDRDYPDNVDPSIPWFQGGIGLSLIVYP